MLECAHIKKSKSEQEAENIINSINQSLWKHYKFDVIYYLGIINQLKALAENLDRHVLTKRDLIMLINHFKTMDSVPDEIKNLVSVILDEFDYKEENK